MGLLATTTGGQRVRAEDKWKSGRGSGGVCFVSLLFQMLQLEVESAIMCRLPGPVKRKIETDQILASRSGEYEALVKKAAPDQYAAAGSVPR